MNRDEIVAVFVETLRIKEGAIVADLINLVAANEPGRKVVDIKALITELKAEGVLIDSMVGLRQGVKLNPEALLQINKHGSYPAWKKAKTRAAFWHTVKEWAGIWISLAALALSIVTTVMQTNDTAVIMQLRKDVDSLMMRR